MSLSLSKFLMITYGYTGMSIVISVLGGIIYSHLSFTSNIKFGLLFLGSVLSMIGISCVKLYSKGRHCYYGIFILGMMLITGPAIEYAYNTDILVPALVTSSLVFGGAVFGASQIKEEEALQLKPVIGGLLMSLLGCGILSFIGIWTNSPLLQWFHSLDLYGGIIVFILCIIYDTHKSVAMFRQGKTDPLNCSIEFYLDFMNILVRVIQIIAKNKTKSSNDNNDQKKNKSQK